MLSTPLRQKVKEFSFEDLEGSRPRDLPNLPSKMFRKASFLKSPVGGSLARDSQLFLKNFTKRFVLEASRGLAVCRNCHTEGLGNQVTAYSRVRFF